jgi:hypothetical protein
MRSGGRSENPLSPHRRALTCLVPTRWLPGQSGTRNVASMKTLLKFAVGAAIAGALVNMLLKQRSGNGQIADTNSVGNAESQRGPQPQDWRGAQNVSGS